MNRHFDTHFQKEVVTVHPGEFYTSTEDIYIATVLGSCISIALFDSEISLGGINHFMLPKSGRPEKPDTENEGRFGDYAVELLINSMLKKGAQKNRLRAKVFGGSAVLETNTSTTNRTGLNNISFAMEFLRTENIPILVNDTGGILPRKIYVHPRTAKVYLKRIQPSGMNIEQIKKREEEYLERIKQTEAKAGEITWF